MAKPVRISLECPNGGHLVDDVYAGVLNLSGNGFRADFKPGYESIVPLSELLLYQCDICGYTERSVLDLFEKQISEELKTFLDNSLQKNSDVDSQKPLENLSQSKFVNYALILEFQGARPFDVGKAWLRASWKNDSKYFQELALEKFNESVNTSDVISKAEAPLAAYLGGELARKLGKYTTAERLYTTSINLVQRLPELIQRAYEFLIEMAKQQAISPSDNPDWDFSEGLILEPLDYYHAKILYAFGDNTQFGNKADALKLFKRSFDICQPALHRIISTKTPQLKYDSQEDYFIKQMTNLSKTRFSKGFWVDDCLVKLGFDNLMQLNDLKINSSDAQMTKEIDSSLMLYLGNESKFKDEIQNLSQSKSTDTSGRRYSEKAIERFWSVFFFVFQYLLFSSIAVGITTWGLGQFNVTANFLILFGATLAGLATWSLTQKAILFLSKGIFSLVKKPAHPMTEQISTLIGLFAGVFLAVYISSWPVIISIVLVALMVFFAGKLVP